MGLIIDTSILIALEKNKLSIDKWINAEPGYINPVSLTELLMGFDKADNENRRIKRLAFIEYVKSLFAALPFGIEEAQIYARIIHNLYEKDIAIGTHDMLIAATAITNGFPILTLNTKDFKRIHGLKVLTVNSID
ncbi:MAG: PIN domain-containing protein [Rickettsia endosymbiont of Pentastiridius leporinus]